MKFDIGADEGGGKFGVGSSTGACTPDLRGDVMELLAVLFRDNTVSSSKDKNEHLSLVLSTLSATIGPLVALVSAAICTSPSN